MRKPTLEELQQIIGNDRAFARKVKAIVEAAKRTGRPERVPGEPTKVRTIRVTESEWQAWSKHAGASISVSDWIRESCNARTKGGRK